MGALTYQLVADVGFNISRARRDPLQTIRLCQPQSLGPLIELTLLLQTNDVPTQQLRSALSRTRTLDAMIQGAILGSHSWQDERRAVAVVSCEGSPTLDPTLSQFGVHEASERYLDRWSKFARHLELCSERCGLSRKTAQGLAGVVQELQDNIFEHSCRPSTGLVGFRQDVGAIEVVVADAGVGVLGGFRQVGETTLNDHSEALRAVVYDNESRFEKRSGHGSGLRQIFGQLATLRGDLRFRTGDVSLGIYGNNFTIDTIEESIEASFEGFLVSILIRPQGIALRDE